MILPTLYKTTKTGAIQVCSISFFGGTFTVEWGQQNGAMQLKTTQCKSLNVGKSNETTPSEQAEKEARAKWASKVKTGYSEDVTAPVTVRLPMKVGVWPPKKELDEILISTPKFNGVNGTYRLEKDILNLYSRGGELLPAVPHLEKEVRQVMQLVKSKELNGELYIHGEHLQDITSAVKKPKDLSKELEFCIFDIADSNLPYSERRVLLQRITATIPLGYIQILTGVLCKDYEAIEEHFNRCISLNYEGTVIKTFDNVYKHNIRSSTQWKYKKALDAEYLIRSMNIDKNGHPVFICSAGPNLGDFKVKPKGTDEERKQIVKDFDTIYNNQWYKVEYEMLSKDAIPLKPVGIGLRTCTEEGTPTI